MSSPSEASIGSRESDRYGEIRRVTLVGAVLDLVLAVVKLIVGSIAQSQSLIADGVHSLSDLATDAMVLIAAKHGSREADDTHPYGHGRIETLATIALGIILLLIAAGIGWDAIQRLFHPENLFQPGVAALAVAAVSVVSKEWIYHYTMRLANRLNSAMLRANAWHSRSDAISSVIVVIGIAGTLAGLPYLDAIAAVGVALMIAKIGWDLTWQSAHELIDTALEADRVQAIREVICGVDGVEALHTLRTRRMGGDALVDVHIQVPPHLSVSEGHHISETVRSRLIKEVAEVQDVLVHIDPEDDETSALTVQLPSRRNVLAQLKKCWESIPEAGQIERITLHYLDGKVAVEIALPLSVVPDGDRVRLLTEKFSLCTKELPEDISGIRVFYY